MRNSPGGYTTLTDELGPPTPAAVVSSSSASNKPMLDEFISGQTSLLRQSEALLYEINEDDVSGIPVGDDDNGSRSSASQAQGRGDWNSRFQELVEMMNSFKPSTPAAIRAKAVAELHALSQDFVTTATAYGRIIISERFLTDKTIRPINIGGVAGGEKFLVHNILFKFAVDSAGLLGSDYAAAKVAGNELKGLISHFYSSTETALCVPLMALVDFLGFRVIAMSVLPLRPTSLVYGTRDGGNTVHCVDPRMRGQMAKMCTRFNLQPHYVGVKKGKQGVLLHSAADIEGHVGSDGRLYLLDFSRTWPPVTPDPRIRAGHLYRVMRPEFVMTYSKPLCPDAFSSFILCDPQCRTYNQDVREATAHLVDIVIPQAVKDVCWIIIEATSKGTLLSFSLTEFMHSRGINMRYLGLMLRHVRQEEERFKVATTVIISEAIARVVKYFMRALLRRKMKQFTLPMEATYRSVVVEYMNLVFGWSAESEAHWNSMIKHQLRKKFSVGPPFTSSSIWELKPLLTSNFFSKECDCLLLVFTRLQHMGGFQFSDLACKKFSLLRSQNNKTTMAPFQNTDLLSLHERVKHMGIVQEAKALSSFHRGVREYKKEMKRFGNARAEDSPDAPPSLASSTENKERPTIPKAPSESLAFIRRIRVHSTKKRPVSVTTSVESAAAQGPPTTLRDQRASRMRLLDASITGALLPVSTDEEVTVGGPLSSSTFDLSLGVPFSEATHFLEEARREFRTALQSWPKNADVLFYLAQASARLAMIRHTRIGIDPPGNLTLTWGDPDVEQADMYFGRAVNESVFRMHSSPFLCYKYANFLVRCRRFDRAEHYYLRALEADPDLVNALRCYAHFLKERGQDKDAVSFLNRMATVKNMILDYKAELVSQPSKPSRTCGFLDYTVVEDEEAATDVLLLRRRKSNPSPVIN